MKKSNKLIKKTNTPSYYRCLASKTSKDLKQPITKCCQDCKNKSQNFSLQRQEKIKKLAKAYKQIGILMSKLLSE